MASSLLYCFFAVWMMLLLLRQGHAAEMVVQSTSAATSRSAPVTRQLHSEEDQHFQSLDHADTHGSQQDDQSGMKNMIVEPNGGSVILPFSLAKPESPPASEEASLTRAQEASTQLADRRLLVKEVLDDFDMVLSRKGWNPVSWVEDTATEAADKVAAAATAAAREAERVAEAGVKATAEAADKAAREAERVAEVGAKATAEAANKAVEQGEKAAEQAEKVAEAGVKAAAETANKAAEVAEKVAEAGVKAAEASEKAIASQRSTLESLKEKGQKGLEAAKKELEKRSEVLKAAEDAVYGATETKLESLEKVGIERGLKEFASEAYDKSRVAVADVVEDLQGLTGAKAIADEVAATANEHAEEASTIVDQITFSPTMQPTSHPTFTHGSPCQVTIYEHWAKDDSHHHLIDFDKFSDLHDANLAWHHKHPTGRIDVLEGTGAHTLVNTSLSASSVKVEGACCKAEGYIDSECTVKHSNYTGPITFEEQDIRAEEFRGIVVTASHVRHYWGCNDCHKCVIVTHDFSCGSGFSTRTTTKTTTNVPLTPQQQEVRDARMNLPPWARNVEGLVEQQFAWIRQGVKLPDFHVCGNYCGKGWCNGKYQSEHEYSGSNEPKAVIGRTLMGSFIGAAKAAFVSGGVAAPLGAAWGGAVSAIKSTLTDVAQGVCDKTEPPQRLLPFQIEEITDSILDFTNAVGSIASRAHNDPHGTARAAAKAIKDAVHHLDNISEDLLGEKVPLLHATSDYITNNAVEAAQFASTLADKSAKATEEAAMYAAKAGKIGLDQACNISQTAIRFAEDAVNAALRAFSRAASQKAAEQAADAVAIQAKLVIAEVATLAKQVAEETAATAAEVELTLKTTALELKTAAAEGLQVAQATAEAAAQEAANAVQAAKDEVNKATEVVERAAQDLLNFVEDVADGIFGSVIEQQESVPASCSGFVSGVEKIADQVGFQSAMEKAREAAHTAKEAVVEGVLKIADALDWESCADSCCKQHDECCGGPRDITCNQIFRQCLSVCENNPFAGWDCFSHYGFPVAAGAMKMAFDALNAAKEDMCCGDPCEIAQTGR